METLAHQITFVHCAANVFFVKGAPNCFYAASALMSAGWVRQDDGSFEVRLPSGRYRTFANRGAVLAKIRSEVRQWAFECPVTVS